MTPIEITMVHASMRFLKHHSTASAAVLPLPDGKVVAVGTEAELAKMLGSISYTWNPLDFVKQDPAWPYAVQPAAPSIPRQMVIHAIIGAGFASMQMADEYTKLKLAKFTGNQWNENWDRDSDALSKLTNLELATIYSRVTA